MNRKIKNKTTKHTPFGDVVIKKCVYKTPFGDIQINDYEFKD